ncbi:hypothetical protein Misp02_62340 [Microtetraspora sp. NBRC 16547]|nr:hypothetical protein Misp02_62340 [Microtetraspora sp. NBRC 16547]
MTCLDGWSRISPAWSPASDTAVSATVARAPLAAPCSSFVNMITLLPREIPSCPSAARAKRANPQAGRVLTVVTRAADAACE